MYGQAAELSATNNMHFGDVLRYQGASVLRIPAIILLTGQSDDTSISETKHELETVLLCVRIPMGPIPVSSIISFILDFTSWDTEGDSFVGFSRYLTK